jgi:hypothetical protein
MSRDRVMRSALWAAALLNAAGLAVFVPPAIGLAPDLLPVPGPPFYAAQVALTIALFGGVYVWLAFQPEINRPLVVVGALGKLGFFLLAVAYWISGDLPANAVPKAAPDLVLALIFFWWIRTGRSASSDLVPA